MSSEAKRREQFEKAQGIDASARDGAGYLSERDHYAWEGYQLAHMVLFACKNCGGGGYTVESDTVCCGNALSSGECCGMGVEEQVQVGCDYCQGTGIEAHQSATEQKKPLVLMMRERMLKMYPNLAIENRLDDIACNGSAGAALVKDWDALNQALATIEQEKKA